MYEPSCHPGYCRGIAQSGDYDLRPVRHSTHTKLISASLACVYLSPQIPASNMAPAQYPFPSQPGYQNVLRDRLMANQEHSEQYREVIDQCGSFRCLREARPG